MWYCSSETNKSLHLILCLNILLPVKCDIRFIDKVSLGLDYRDDIKYPCLTAKCAHFESQSNVISFIILKCRQ